MSVVITDDVEYVSLSDDVVLRAKGELGDDECFLQFLSCLGRDGGLANRGTSVEHGFPQQGFNTGIFLRYFSDGVGYAI